MPQTYIHCRAGAALPCILRGRQRTTRPRCRGPVLAPAPAAQAAPVAWQARWLAPRPHASVHVGLHLSHPLRPAVPTVHQDDQSCTFLTARCLAPAPVPPLGRPSGRSILPRCRRASTQADSHGARCWRPGAWARSDRDAAALDGRERGTVPRHVLVVHARAEVDQRRHLQSSAGRARGEGGHAGWEGQSTAGTEGGRPGRHVPKLELAPAGW